jgi:hypothetical protein
VMGKIGDDDAGDARHVRGLCGWEWDGARKIGDCPEWQSRMAPEWHLVPRQ